MRSFDVIVRMFRIFLVHRHGHPNVPAARQRRKAVRRSGGSSRAAFVGPDAAIRRSHRSESGSGSPKGFAKGGLRCNRLGPGVDEEVADPRVVGPEREEALRKERNPLLGAIGHLHDGEDSRGALAMKSARPHDYSPSVVVRKNPVPHAAAFTRGLPSRSSCGPQEGPAEVMPLLPCFDYSICCREPLGKMLTV